MKYDFLFPLFLLTVFAFTSTDLRLNPQYEKNSAKPDSSTTVLRPLNKVPAVDTIPSVKDKLSNRILGVWTIVGEENPSFEILKDGIIYPDLSAIFKYRIIKDSMKINYKTFFESFAISLRGNDTLIFRDKKYMYKFCRVHE
jgi:hypothetical protein